jgi:Cu/Ag efflux protein CusF
MKKALALAVVLVFCAAIGFAAGADKAVKPIEATISKLDMAGKSMVVKKADGKEMTIYWNDDTKVEGVLKEGATIHFKTSEKDGKTWATKVHIANKTKKAA